MKTTIYIWLPRNLPTRRNEMNKKKIKFKTCPICKAKFKIVHKNHKYCSTHCKQQDRKGCLPLKKCKNCKKMFNPWNRLSLFCNLKCYNEFKIKNAPTPSRRVKSIIKICQECGKKFHPYSANKKGRFCSLSCYWTNCRKNNKPKTKKCKICGKKFIPWNTPGSKIRPYSKYCSHKCAGLGISKTTKNKRKKTWGKRSETAKTSFLDNLWRQKVYENGGKRCEYCNKTEKLNAHHIFSRSNYVVRWDLDNGVCLCVSHHIFGKMSFHKSPIEMLEWLKKKRGNKWYKTLRKKAQTTKPVKKIKEEAIKNLEKL